MFIFVFFFIVLLFLYPSCILDISQCATWTHKNQCSKWYRKKEVLTKENKSQIFRGDADARGNVFCYHRHFSIIVAVGFVFVYFLSCVLFVNCRIFQWSASDLQRSELNFKTSIHTRIPITFVIYTRNANIRRLIIVLKGARRMKGRTKKLYTSVGSDYFGMHSLTFCAFVISFSFYFLSYSALTVR